MKCEHMSVRAWLRCMVGVDSMYVPTRIACSACMFNRCIRTCMHLQLRTEAKYTLQVRVLSYENPSNKDAAGKQCDPFDTTCDSIFTFCISEPGMDNCNLGSVNTQPYYIEALSYIFTLGQELVPGSGIPNPVEYSDVIQAPLGNRWPVSGG